MSYRFFLFVIVLLSPALAFSQLDNSALYLNLQADSVRPGRLSLQTDILGYFKNNEYFAETVDGYTLFGYQAPLALYYQIDQDWSLAGGVYLQKDFGGEGFMEIDPVFSLRYCRGPWFAAFGTLDGSLDHRLIEPLYDFELRLLDPLENGLQFRYNDDRLFADLWVDWQQVIFPDDEGQEVITGGLSASYAVVRREGLRLELPFQVVLAHQGGQINTANDDPVFTQSNVAFGARFTVTGGEIVNEWGLQPYAVVYGGNIPDGLLAFKQGSGLYLNGHLTTKWLTLMASYWNGADYLSYQGGDLYESASRSVVNPLAIEPDRELLIIRLLKDMNLAEGIRLSVRAEPVWNLDSGAFDISYGLYITYNGGFGLAKNTL